MPRNPPPGASCRKLQELTDEFGDEVLVDDVLFRRHEPGSVTYHSLCGGLPVHRDSYRQVGIAFCEQSRVRIRSEPRHVVKIVTST